MHAPAFYAFASKSYQTKRHASGVPFSRPKGAVSCRILPSAKQAGQALRRAPHKIPQESRGVYLTFLPLPAPRRRGLVRRTPGHLLLPFQGNSPCADERGYRFRFLRNRKRIQGGQRPPWKFYSLKSILSFSILNFSSRSRTERCFFSSPLMSTTTRPESIMMRRLPY